MSDPSPCTTVAPVPCAYTQRHTRAARCETDYTFHLRGLSLITSRLREGRGLVDAYIRMGKKL